MEGQRWSVGTEQSGECTEFPLSLAMHYDANANGLRHAMPSHAMARHSGAHDLNTQAIYDARCPRSTASGEATVEWAINLLNEFACNTKGSRQRGKREPPKPVMEAQQKQTKFIVYTKLFVKSSGLRVGHREEEKEKERETA